MTEKKVYLDELQYNPKNKKEAMNTQYNEKKSMEKVEQKFKELGITRTFDEFYDDIYCGDKKRTKDYRLLSNYYKSVGLELQSFNCNPYHLYNHYYYNINQMSE